MISVENSRGDYAICLPRGGAMRPFGNVSKMVISCLNHQNRPKIGEGGYAIWIPFSTLVMMLSVNVSGQYPNERLYRAETDSISAQLLPNMPFRTRPSWPAAGTRSRELNSQPSYCPFHSHCSCKA